jgi:hypothetical protein
MAGGAVNIIHARTHARIGLMARAMYVPYMRRSPAQGLAIGPESAQAALPQGLRLAMALFMLCPS